MGAFLTANQNSFYEQVFACSWITIQVRIHTHWSSFRFHDEFYCLIPLLALSSNLKILNMDAHSSNLIKRVKESCVRYDLFCSFMFLTPHRDNISIVTAETVSKCYSTSLKLLPAHAPLPHKKNNTCIIQIQTFFYKNMFLFLRIFELKKLVVLKVMHCCYKPLLFNVFLNIFH